MTLPAAAAWAPAAINQYLLPAPRQMSIDGTDRPTDGHPTLHRACTAYASSITNQYNFYRRDAMLWPRVCLFVSVTCWSSIETAERTSTSAVRLCTSCSDNAAKSIDTTNFRRLEMRGSRHSSLYKSLFTENGKKVSSPYSITERTVPKLIPVLDSQPAGDVSHKPGVGCHYFPSGLQLPPQPLKGVLPILLLSEQRHDGCEQFA